MSDENDAVEIVICLGSSCYARGNAENLGILKKHAQAHGSKVTLRLTGSLCQEQCKHGPNVMIAGELHHGVTAVKLRELLQQLAQQPTRASGGNQGAD